VQIVKGEATPLSTPPSAETSTPDLSAEANAEDRAFVERATRVVLDHLSDSDFDIDHLCREMAMSRTLFYGRLKSLTAQGPQEFIRNIRLERAAMLLRQGTPVLDVSVKTGFVNAKYFSTIFKKHFGVPPSKFC
jgi:AraC-like DNA-binding protein